jgi:hypothetical protein
MILAQVNTDPKLASTEEENTIYNIGCNEIQLFKMLVAVPAYVMQRLDNLTNDVQILIFELRLPENRI